MRSLFLISNILFLLCNRLLNRLLNYWFCANVAQIPIFVLNPLTGTQKPSKHLSFMNKSASGYHHLNFYLFVVGSLMFFSCGGQEKELSEFSDTMDLEVSNPLDRERSDVMVYLNEKELLSKYPNFNSKGFVVKNGDIEIPSQYNENGHEIGIVFVLPFIGPKETLAIQIAYHTDNEVARDYPKLTQAELSHKVGGHFENREYIGGNFQNVEELNVPAEHTDHSWFIRYEGPGWESDMVGYRFYLDWRNGVDVFGKKVPEPILQRVGHDNFDSYHEMSDWGMDVLKVGSSLGVGSIATFIDGQARRVDVTDSLYVAVRNNGPVYSSIETKYYGWDLGDFKTTITSNLSIHAGTRLSKQLLNSSDDIGNFATGLIKDDKAEIMTGGEGLAFEYLATYGPQSLAGDKLGIAVIFSSNQKMEFTQDDNSHVVVLKPENNNLSYYFLAAWEQEKDGIKDKESFIKYLDQLVEELSNPLVVTF